MQRKHSLLMFICCLLPIGVLFALPLMGIGPNSLSFLAIILLCPLLHLLMMRRTHDHHQEAGEAPPAGESGKGDERRATLIGKRTK